MTTADEQGRPEPPVAADEAETLPGFLDYQRATLEWETSRPDAAGLAATTAASSSITLGGILKRRAFAEDWRFSRSLLGPDGPGSRTESSDRPDRPLPGRSAAVTELPAAVIASATPVQGQSAQQQHRLTPAALLIPDHGS